ncbi:MAG: efflux transporter outer membrane subunit [Janthinobacterium lividum]
MKRLAGAALALLLAGCAIPHVETAVKPVDARSIVPAGTTTPAIDATWWTALGDPQLDRLIADALAGNPTLDTAAARVRQAQAALSARRADNGPNVTLDTNTQVQRLSGAYIYPPPYGGSVYFVGTVGANLAWDLDLFGKQKEAIRGAAAGVRGAQLDAASARLMLAGSVAQSYFELVRAERQADIAARTIHTREGYVRLVEVRIRSQLASKLDAEAAQTLLAQARGALIEAQGARVLAVDALAALAGKGPDYAAAIGPAAVRADTLALPATVPADLLARRADIAAAQARIAAATHGREEARRAFYPDVNLLGLAGFQSLGLPELFGLGAATVGGGPAIHLPLFDNGRLKADLVGRTAELDLAIANYNDTVLQAVRQTADAIARIRSLDAERAQSGAVVRGFGETNRLNGIRVQSGLNSRLDLIDTDIRLLDAELTDANLATNAHIARVQLVIALGGGFDPAGIPQ